MMPVSPFVVDWVPIVMPFVVDFVPALRIASDVDWLLRAQLGRVCVVMWGIL